jgi:hypothetical protein
MSSIFIKGEKIDLCAPEESDFCEWANWFNDQKITQFLEQGKYPNTINLQKNFYKKELDNNRFIVLVKTKSRKLLGVISLSDIKFDRKSCQVSYVIPKKSIDAKFAALEALALVVEHAFIRLGMEVVWSGHAYPGLRNWIIKTGLLGFRINGLLPCEFVHGTFVSDAVRTSITKDKFNKLIKQRGQLWPGQQVVSKLVNSIKGNEDFFEKVILNISKQNEKYDMYWEEKENKII